MAERRPIVLSLVSRGSPEFPRYAIADQFLRYWTGETWSDDEDHGLLFADPNTACDEMQKLLMVDYMDKPVRRFRAPIYVDLYTANDVTLRDLKDWLFKVSRLLIDSPKHGNGPVEGSLGLCQIDWSELEEVPK